MIKIFLFLFMVISTAMAEVIIDQNIMNVTVVKAELIGTLKPASSSITSTYSLDIGECRLISERNSMDEDCHFYNECKVISVDCTHELEKIFNMPLTHKVLFHDIKKTVVTYSTNAPKEIAGKTIIDYYSSKLDCNVLKSITASRLEPFNESVGLGVNFRYIPKEELKSIGTAIFRSGEHAVIHEFASVVLCKTGVSSMERTTYSYKPFMQFVDKKYGTIFRTWDTVPGNFWISTRTSSFNRIDEVLIPGTMVLTNEF